MSKCYAGIGSRSMPPGVMTELLMSAASLLEEKEYTLRSGGAEGADQAFELGVTDAVHKQIFLAQGSTFEAEQIAASVHPAWDKCNAAARKYLGRNVQIILGADLKSPVEFVLLWSRDITQGGTNFGFRLAVANKLPVFNLSEKAGFLAWAQYYAERIVDGDVT